MSPTQSRASLTLLAGLLTGAVARAEDTAPSCDVPAYLLTTESALTKVGTP